MQKIFLAFACQFFFTWVPCLAQKYSLSGNITEEATGSPIPGVNVYLNGTTFGTATNVNGNFTLRNIKPGEYELVISSVGYRKATQDINVDGDITGFLFSMEKSNSKLGEIVVTGTATPHHLKSAPVQTEVISKKLIQQIAPPTFTDLLASVSPSFDFTQSVMGSFMRLNGLSNDYTLILIDGKRIYGDISGQNDLNRINPNNVDRVEIVKGASSALYGSDAMAGVINVITKKSGNAVNAANNTRFGSYGEWIQHNSLDLNFGRFSSSTSYDHKESDGWKVSDYEIDDDELIETDAMTIYPSTDYTINQKFSYSLTQSLDVYVQGAKYERELSRPQAVSSYGFIYDDFSYSAGAKYLVNKKDYITADWNSDKFKYYYKYNQEDDEFSPGDKELQTEQQLDAFNLKGVFKLSKAHLLSVGGEYMNEELESAGRLLGESASAYTLAAYAQDEIKVVKNLSLVAGLRFVNHKEFGNAVTPKISGLYSLKNFNIRGTYARGFKAPTMKELYYYYQRRSTLYLGNANLDPQTSDYYSASLGYMNQLFSINVTAYQNNVNDMIDYQSVETSEEDAENGISSTRQYCNISKAKTQGIDIVFDAEIGAGFTIGGGYSYVDARNLTDDVRLDYVAENYGNARLGYLRQWSNYVFAANLIARFQDEKFFDDELGNARGYNLWKLTTTHSFDVSGPFDFDLTAGVDNIIDYVDDRPYGSHYGTTTPGRTFFIGLNIQFSR